MQTLTTGLITACILLSSLVGFGQDEADDDDGEYTGPIAVNGGVHIDGIELSRQVMAGAKKDVKLSRLHLSFWFPETDAPVADSSYTIRLETLESIEDDLGNALLAEDRRKWIHELRGDARSRAVVARKGRQGPILSFDLDVPARTASTLKRVKGVAHINKVSTKILSFEKFAAKLGKALEHESLGDFKIIPVSIKAEEGEVKCCLRLPAEHSRLEDWTLFKGENPLRPISIGESPSKDKKTTEETRTFAGKSTESLALYLKFSVAGEPQRYEFEFLDVPLP